MYGDSCVKKNAWKGKVGEIEEQIFNDFYSFLIEMIRKCIKILVLMTV